MKLEISFVFLMHFALITQAYGSGTSIGNGGDPVFHFLETTRYSLRQTAEFLKTNPNSICGFNEMLTREQQKDCGNFAQEVISQVIALNAPQSSTAFVLRNDSLMVEGPDGVSMPVAARTQLGKDGPIEFHRSSIEFLSPTLMLSLIAHEFGHKVKFSDRHIQDNLPIMSFSRGRDLLDAFGKAITYWAIRKGYVGSNFTLRDLFSCEIHSSAGKFRVRVSSPRRFKGQDYEKYEITMGYNPTDPRIEVPELSGNTLLLRLHINESRSCIDENPERRSRLEIIRLIANSSTSELISKNDFWGINPICNPSKEPLTIEAAGFRFSCEYVGSEAVTANSAQLIYVQFQ